MASWTTGEATSFTAIMRDITERKRAEEMRCAKEAAAGKLLPRNQESDSRPVGSPQLARSIAGTDAFLPHH